MAQTFGSDTIWFGLALLWRVQRRRWNWWLVPLFMIATQQSHTQQPLNSRYQQQKWNNTFTMPSSDEPPMIDISHPPGFLGNNNTSPTASQTSLELLSRPSSPAITTVAFADLHNDKVPSPTNTSDITTTRGDALLVMIAQMQQTFLSHVTTMNKKMEDMEDRGSSSNSGSRRKPSHSHCTRDGRHRR